MAAFILFDTQHIIEKVRNGNRDVVQHALDLFFDILSIFRRLIIILTQKVNIIRILFIISNKVFEKMELYLLMLYLLSSF